MARLPYEENQSIHSMTTRQLRQYIADQADEAEKRITSVKGETSKAFDELKAQVTYRSGKIKRSTSNMSKAEMREYAYTLNMFNRFDTESRYAQKTEYQKNRQRYESFIRNQVSKSGADNQYWAKYITEKGNISKRGYQEYKDFISTLSASEKYLEAYGYRTIQQYAQNNNKLDPGNKILNRVLSQVYIENKGKGLTQAELIDRFKLRYDEALNKEASKQKKPASKAKISTSKRKAPKSSTNIKVKTTGKMKPSGTVRRKLT